MDRQPHPQISMHDCCEDEDDEDSDEIEHALKINTWTDRYTHQELISQICN